MKDPREETTAWVTYAIETAEAMLARASGSLSPGSVDSRYAESEDEERYWLSVRNRLFDLRSTLYVVVEQLVDGLNYLQGVPYETSPTLRLRLAFGDLSVQLRKYLGELEPPLGRRGACLGPQVAHLYLPRSAGNVDRFGDHPKAGVCHF